LKKEKSGGFGSGGQKSSIDLDKEGPDEGKSFVGFKVDSGLANGEKSFDGTNILALMAQVKEDKGEEKEKEDKES